jgi:hypothetical protein
MFQSKIIVHCVGVIKVWMSQNARYNCEKKLKSIVFHILQLFLDVSLKYSFCL